MIFGVTPFSHIPFSTVVNDYSIDSLFSALIANQDADRAYLLDCQPYDPATSAEVDVGFSVGLMSPILDNRAWPVRLGTVLNAEVNLFGDSIGQGGSSSFGYIKILIGDGDHDEILDYVWDGRTIRVLMGAEGYDFTQFQPVFVGTAADITFDDRYLSIILRDKSVLLQSNIQTNVYAGTGGLNGGADIKNQYKPLCFGVRKNIAPVLVDRANLIWQWHDGSSLACDGAFDGALALTSAGNVADITATSVTAGQYKTQLSGSYIKLGAEPTKALTLDVRGDNSGTGYVDTAADITQRVIVDHSQATVDDINLQSIADTNTANSASTGWYGASGSVGTVISKLLESIGGGYVFDRSGQLVTGVFKFNTSVGTLEEKDIVSLNRVRTPAPTWSRAVGFAQSGTVQGPNDVVAGATNARKDFVSREYRLAVSDDVTVRTRRKLADSVVINTLLDDGTAAAAEAARQQLIFGADRHRYDVVAKRQQFKYRPGQTITVNYSRFGFPKTAIILGIVEDTDRRYTTFRIFV